MTGCQRDKLIAPAGKKNIAISEQCPGPLARNGRKHRLEVVFNGRSREQDLQPDRASRILYGCRIALGIGVVRIDQHRDDLGCRYQLMQKPKLLRRQRAGNQVKPCQIATRAAEAGDQAPWTGSIPVLNTIGIVVVAA